MKDLNYLLRLGTILIRKVNSSIRKIEGSIY